MKMNLKLISRFNKNFSILIFYILFVYLISFGFSYELSNNDFLTDKLHSAALQVISLHNNVDNNPLLNDINEDLSQQPIQDIKANGSRSKRSVPSFYNIPVLDNFTNILHSSNREDLMIEHFRKERLDVNVVKEMRDRSYVRFNSTDFVMDFQDFYLNVWRMTHIMDNLKERFVFQQTYLQKISDALKYAIKPHSNTLIINPIILKNLTVFNEITVNQIKTLTNIFWQNSKLTVNDLKYKIKDLVNIINSIEQQIGNVLRITSEVVLRNKPSIITGHKKFVGHNEVLSINTTSALIGSVGRQDLRQVMNNLYRKSRPQIVRGVKHIIKPTFVNNFINSGLINGMDFNKQIVTTNTPQIIKSVVSFNSHLMVTNDVTISGKVNNLDLDKELLFLNKPEVVLARKVFTSPLIIAQNVNTLTIDGIDLIKLSQNVLLSTALQTINSKLILLKPFTTKSISIDGMVNDIDISAMASQLVYKNRPVQVRGKKTFILDDIYIKNNLIVRKRLDGYIVPEDLLLRSRNQIITAPKFFRGETRFVGKVIVRGFVDGLRLPQDIVTLTRNETIFGPIVFGQSIAVNQDIDARRLVDGVDLSELRLYSLKINEKLIRSDVRFTKPVTIGALELSGDVNGVNLGNLFREAIFKGSPNVEIIGAKNFDSHIQSGQLYTELVNGVNLNDLVSTHKNETISALKVFTALTSFASIDVKGSVGRVNIESLYNNRISLSKPESITGTKNFLDELIVGQWLTVGSINKMVPQIDFVLKSKFQEINGLKIFRKTLNANHLIVRNSTSVKGTIDKILINDLNSRVIRLNVHQTIPLNIILINSNSTFVDVYKDLNGLNIRQFADNVMSLTKSQIVLAPKLFKNEQTFSRIESSKEVSGVSLSYLSANAVHLNRMSQIRAPFTFMHPVFFNKPLIVNGVVNGVNLSLLSIDAVYKRGQNLITGHNVFKSGFRVDGNINGFTFNGIDLSKELLTNTRNHIIRGKVKFTKSLNINGDIVLNGLINGLDLSEFNKGVIKTNSRNIINGNLELIGPTRVETNININGRLNGINLTQLFNNAVFLNSNQIITGVKTVIAPIRFSNNLNTTQLNGINVPQILEDIVYIDSLNEQQIFAPKVFTNDITSNGLIQSKGIANMGPINGLNLNKLDFESIKLNKASNLRTILTLKDSTILTNNLTTIYGRINGIDLLRDPILLNTNNKEPQRITGHKVFEHLILNDNAIVNGLINGFPLKDIESNTLFTSNDQRIIGHKIINGLLELRSGNNMVAILNGMTIPEDLVTLNDNQTIFSHLIFNNTLVVNKNLLVNGYVSGHNLSKLVTESLVNDRPQILFQPIKFDSIVFRHDVNVGQHVDNVDLSALSNTVKQFTSVVNISKDLLIVKANRNHFVSDYLYRSLEKSNFEIDSFNLYQTLDEIHGNHIDVLANGVLTISETIENPPNVHSIKFDPKTELFNTSHIVQNSNFIVNKPFILNKEEFVLHMSPHSYNYSSHITKSGQLIATIGSFLNSIEVLKVSRNRVLFISFQSTSAKLMVHSLESLPNNKYIFAPIIEMNLGLETSKVIAFLKERQIYIVVVKHYGMNCVIERTGTLIFILRDNRILELIQKIPVMNIVDVIHFENNGKHYLALSDGTSIESSMSPQTIYIYRSELMRQMCGFSLFQKLYFDNVIQLSSFTYGTTHSEHQYLAAVNSSNIMVWKQSGESGFNENWLLHTNSARVLVPWLGSGRLYLIIGQNYKCHESLIFRAKTRGIELAPIVFNTKYN